MSAAKAAPPAAAHSRSQNQRLRVGAVSRLSGSARPRATGRATSSRTPAAKGVRLVIRSADSNPPAGAVHGTATRPSTAPARGAKDTGSPDGLVATPAG